MTPLKALIILAIMLVYSLIFGGKKDPKEGSFEERMQVFSVIIFLFMLPISAWCVIKYIKF